MRRRLRPADTLARSLGGRLRVVCLVGVLVGVVRCTWLSLRRRLLPLWLGIVSVVAFGIPVLVVAATWAVALAASTLRSGSSSLLVIAVRGPEP